MIKFGVGNFLRYLRLEWSYLSCGYLLFQLQIGLYILIDVGLLTALNNFKLIADPTIGFERMALLFAFTGVMATVATEFKGQYTDSIQLFYGTWLKRYLYRAFSTALVIGLVFDAIIVGFSKFSPDFLLHVNFTLHNVFGFDTALILVSLFGAFLASFLKATFLANILPAIVLILETSIGGIVKGHAARWSFTGIFLPLLQAHSLSRVLLEMLIYLVIAVALVSALNRRRTSIENALNLEASKSFSLRKKGGEPLSWRIARSIESRNHDLGIRFAQLFTNTQFLRLPILFLWLGVVPLFSNKILTIGGSERVIIPIVTGSTVQTIFMISLISPSILEGKEFIENELILFKSREKFIAATRRLWQMICSVWALLIVAISVVIFSVHGGKIDLSFSARPLLVAFALAPLFVSLSFAIMRLPIEPRFFSIIAIVYYVLDVAIVGSIKGVSRFEPTSLIANLAGGRGLYQIVLNEKAVSAPLIAIWLIVAIVLFNVGLRLFRRERVKVA